MSRINFECDTLENKDNYYDDLLDNYNKQMIYLKNKINQIKLYTTDIDQKINELDNNCIKNIISNLKS